jgi:hypothetical protein
MTEHPIRLRGAWALATPDRPDDVLPRYVSLPVSWPESLGSPVSLVRRFQRPPVDPARERIFLRMESVLGLLSVRLNGEEIARPGPGGEALELEVGGRLRRGGGNELALEVDPRPARDRSPNGPWGAIALVIRRED